MINRYKDKEWEPRLDPGQETQPVVREAGELGGETIYQDPAGVMGPPTSAPPDWSAMLQAEQQFVEEQYRQQAIEGVTPSARYWMEHLPAGKPREEKTLVGKALYDLGQWAPIRAVMGAFQFSGEMIEKKIGYYYMGQEDEWLRGPEAYQARQQLANMNPVKIWDSPLWNKERFDELRAAGELTPAQIRAGTAMHTANIFYEATGFPAPSEFFQAWGAFMLEQTPFGDQAKRAKEEWEKEHPDAGRLEGFLGRTWASMKEPWSVFINGFAHYIDHFYVQGLPADEYQEIPEFQRVLDETGLAHLMSKERGEELRQQFRDFWNGDYIDTFGGLPELMATREAMLNGVPVEQALEAYKQNLGGARFEAEMQDIVGQIALDPLDWILTIAKPGQIIKAAGNAARLQRVAPALMDTMGDLGKLIAKFDEIEDVAHITDEVEDLLRLADDANLDDVSKAVKAAQGLIDEGADIERVREALRPITEVQEQLKFMGEMSRMERVGMWLTGGDLLKPVRRTKTPRMLAWMNPLDDRFLFSLSAEARGDEFLNAWYNSTHMLLRMAGRNVDNMVDWLARASAGAFGGKFGHMFITPTGRHVQSVLRAMKSGVDELYAVWQRSTASRRLINNIADAMGENVVSIVNRAGESKKSATAVFEALTEALAKVGDDAPAGIRALKESVENGRFVAGDVWSLGELFKSTPKKIIPYTPELFRAAVVKLGAETAAELAAVRFGLKEANMLEKGANYIKAAESLVLLGGNPLYPVMNFFNNEVTLIARGLTGNIVPAWLQRVIPKPFRAFFPTTDDIMKSFGINPARFREGFGITGADFIEEVGRATRGLEGEAEELAELGGLAAGKRILRASKWGKPGKVGAWFLEKTREVRDFRKLSAIAESMASERAFANAMLKVWPEYWRAGVGFDDIDQFLPGLKAELQAADPALYSILEDAIRSGRRPDDLAVLRKAENLQWNTESLIRRAADRLGVDNTRINNFVTDDVLESIRGILDELGPNANPDDVRQAFTLVRDSVNNHIDELVEAHIPQMIEEAMSQVQIDGINGVIDIYGQMAADMTNRHIAHMGRLDTEVARIMEMSDPALRDRAWRALLADGDDAWRRHWNRQEAMVKGIQRGLRERGVQVGDEYLSSFRAIRNESTKYIRQRNKLWEEFFGKLTKGEFPDEFARVEAVTEIHRALDEGYVNLTRVTENSQAIMDGNFLQALRPHVDNSVYSAAVEWRTMLREMRRADMEGVLEFRQSIRGLTPDQVHVAYLQHHEQRTLALGRMQRLEEYGRVMLNGDEDALRFFRGNAQNRARRAVEMDPAMRQTLETEHAELTARLQGDRIRYEVTRDELAGSQHIRLGADDQSYLRYTVYGDGIKLDEINVTEDFRRSRVGTSLFHEFLDDMQAQGVTEFATRPVTDEGRAFVDFIQESGLVEMVSGDARPDGLGDMIFRITRPPTPSPEEMTMLRARIGEIDEILRPSTVTTNAFVEGPAWNPPVFEPIVGHQWYMGTGLDELWFEEGGQLYDMLQEEALKVLDEPNVRWGNLPQNVQDDLGAYLDHVTGQMNDARLATIRHAEGLRDSALLNYNRRYNFDNFMNVAGPYGFWWTHSMGRWALSTLENTHMIAAYAKMRQFLLDREGVETGFPSRLRGALKLNMPWAPSEFGDTFVNPMRSFGLPFEQFIYPFEQLSLRGANEEQGIQRILQEMVERGDISRQEAELATANKDGPIWNQAKSLYRQDNEYPNMLDFMQMSVSPHLPISYALNIARGTPEKLGALPPVRTMKHLGTLLGVDPGVYDNVIGNARDAIGLPAFDEWDDYRIDRELSNMAAENEITSVDAQLAMINRSGPAYEAARRRVNEQELARFGNRLIGLNVQFYPEGEQEQRELTQQFYNALDIRDLTGSSEELNTFFDEHPEFESRLALFKKPEERTKAFLVDQVWNKWFDLPTVQQNAVKDALGDQFTDLFLNKESRSLDSISTETLAMWARSMNQEVPNIFSEVDAIPIDFAPPHLANQVEAFYRERDRRFPRYWQLQDEYYKLEEGPPRWNYRDEHPALEAYWDWKWDFLYRNPSLAPYIIDDPSKLQYRSIQEYEQAQEQEPDFTLWEWHNVLGAPLYNLVEDNLYYGEVLPQSAREKLERVADDMGISADEILEKMDVQFNQ